MCVCCVCACMRALVPMHEKIWVGIRGKRKKRINADTLLLKEERERDKDII